MCQKVANRKEKWEIEYLLSASLAVQLMSSSSIHGVLSKNSFHTFSCLILSEDQKSLGFQGKKGDQMMVNVNFRKP